MAKHNIRLIKSKRSYSMTQIVSLLKIDRKTCRCWLKKEGLRPIEQNVNPILVIGADLIDFLNKKRAKRRIGLNEGQFFCFKCHKSVRAKAGSEETIKTGKKIGKSNSDQYKKVGNCEVCNTRVNRFIGVSQQD
ncbi:MAG: hypothetical protein A3G02_00385 [Candidatus Yanofskybacteria bacterium RIFCSPLOWO2_12_FULL_44_13b]|uniref:Helix-turn-helix domain-containing protein n=1 Tax=Candidatus Yanofskybacteria bacterium RIFCSPLOWO2_02_FULL_44_18 TaxID=1802705 RepID=A0A1F8H1L9_9BACT|nr:MAG: hypothetical protein A3C01_00280 [Candidatus Yanofskybacteria bacterium RIFCSPHIGHO2_02_FULL_44_36b]OGN30798.1 MAG: hypothetical protein A3I96_03125 [Candidatus Yanofskybacteria bacterium RIFCSPLOWO2_02_FULL_44_18]OGN34919.1 MAG: hypothetical protein A3G02_00385 [Candidatus Yanofskybacteria bacterium RIFCSPLOWO2_12_FULL_44_13b]